MRAIGCFFEKRKSVTEKIGVKERWIYITFVIIIISFCGWILETTLMYILYGEFFDRGFLSLPICPIYGLTILLIYFLIGTANHGGIILKKLPANGLRVLVYFILSALIAALGELFTGFFFEAFKKVELWDYSHLALSIGRYISIEVSCLWGALITIVMLMFEGVIEHMKQIPKEIVKRINFTLLTAVFIDFTVNIVK